MKAKLIFILTLINFISFTSKSQFAYIPDSAFRSYLRINGFASAFNGDSLDTTSTIVDTTLTINCTGLGIQSLEGVQYFNSLKNLICDVNYLTDLPVLSDSLVHINCSKNLLTSLPPLPLNLSEFECDHNQISLLPPLPPNLYYINCSNNLLSSIPTLPQNLTGLDCDSNQISFLPILPNSLGSLFCRWNSIDSLPLLPPNLIQLLCNQNNLDHIPALPNSLLSLRVSNNPIHSLPILPNTLQELLCSENFLDSISVLPDSLYYFDASRNNLHNLPPLSVRLGYLNVWDNHLSSLPILPSGLISLNCGVNPLHNLPGSLPSSLVYLECSLDSLSIIPALPSTISYFSCQNNMIHDLPDLPDSLEYLYIDLNPIHCLPSISYVRYFSWSNTIITCFPQQLHTGWSYPDIDTIPLCQPSSGCDIKWNISGNVYRDINNNCIKDTSDAGLKNIQVFLDSSGVNIQSCFTNANGDYAFRASFGSYTLRLNNSILPNLPSCPQNGIYSTQLSAVDSLIDSLNFALTCPDAFDLIANSITPEINFRPTRLVNVTINAGDIFGKFGTACFDSSGFVECTFTGPISYVGPQQGSLTPIVSAPNTLRWNVSDFSSIDPLHSFNIQVRVDSFASIQSLICFNLGIYPFIGDLRPLNNTTSACYQVFNSIDPNEKYMWPNGSIDTSDHEFNFTIFFQNTGNAPAEDIFIIDTIDNDLDISSFEFVTSSHPVITQILPNNILRFNFPGINLTDSTTDESLSHGQVQFRLRRKPTTGIGTEITNTAYIYFDQNLPISTNEVSATVTSIVGILNSKKLNKLTLFPNPSNTYLSIEYKCNGIGLVTIQNYIGETIEKLQFNSGEYPSLDTSHLNPGLYLISITDKTGTQVGKFIKN